jgi:hypothetical protein
MLIKRYLPSTKNLSAIMQKIVTGTAPAKFNVEHLKGLGFTSSNDRAFIPLLKDLGFLSSDGTPTARYHEYRNTARSRTILGEALREGYQDLFHINATPTKSDRAAIEGKFKSTHNVSDRVAELQAMTFYALLDLADLSEGMTASKKLHTGKHEEAPPPPLPKVDHLNLRYNIELHLPATKDVEVYNAIFKSLKEHLLD